MPIQSTQAKFCNQKSNQVVEISICYNFIPQRTVQFGTESKQKCVVATNITHMQSTKYHTIFYHFNGETKSGQEIKPQSNIIPRQFNTSAKFVSLGVRRELQKQNAMGWHENQLLSCSLH
jgi:hypothetical protein